MKTALHSGTAATWWREHLFNSFTIFFLFSRRTLVMGCVANTSCKKRYFDLKFCVQTQQLCNSFPKFLILLIYFIQLAGLSSPSQRTQNLGNIIVKFERSKSSKFKWVDLFDFKQLWVMLLFLQ